MIKHLYNAVPVICRPCLLLLLVAAGCQCGGHKTSSHGLESKSHQLSSEQPVDPWDSCIGKAEQDRPAVLVPGDNGGQGIETLGVGFIPDIAGGEDQHLRFLRVDRFDTARVFKGEKRIEILEADLERLRGRFLDGRELTLSDWKDVRFVGKINCPTVNNADRVLDINARIAGARELANGPRVYDLQLEIKDDGVWKWVDACGELEKYETEPGENARREVLALRGYFRREDGSYQHADPESSSGYRRSPYISFACTRRNAVKCHDRYGYWVDEPKQPDGEPNGSEVAEFESCVRAMKADYCGTGDSFTLNGRLIDLWPTKPPVVGSPLTNSYQFEAAWGADGALCTSGAYRIPMDYLDPYQAARWKECEAKLKAGRRCTKEKAMEQFPDSLFTAFAPWPADVKLPAQARNPTAKRGGSKRN